MRALTIKQPWINAILYGGKNIENRNWKPPAVVLGQRIALHSSLTYDVAGDVIVRQIIGEPDYDEYVKGAILGTAVVAGYATEMPDPWFAGPYGWLLEDIHVLRNPIPCRGFLGCWRIPEGCLAKILEELVRDGIIGGNEE